MVKDQVTQALVSILTRAFARVQQPGCAIVQVSQVVSILTRAFARVQQQDSRASRGETGVSILTRAFARVQRAWATVTQGSWGVFQSSLELSPECNLRPRSCAYLPYQRFNPHSSFRPSATAPF